MKKIFRFLVWLLVTVISLFVIGTAFIAIRGIPTYTPQKIDLKVEVTPQRVEHGLKLAQNLCIKCHLSPTSNKLGGTIMHDLPGQFGKGFSANITNDKEHGIGNWTDGDIIYFLRTGVRQDGRYAPPWMPKFVHMSDEDLYSIIAFLRSNEPVVQASSEQTQLSEPSFLAKFLTNTVFKALPYPSAPIAEPDTNNLILYGKYLVAGRYDCFPCHSADFKTMNIMEPEKTPGYMGGGNTIINMEHKGVHSANLTADETGIASWSLAQFSDAIRLGKLPSGGSVRYPMVPYPHLTDREVEAIYAYLRSIPKIKNKVSRDIVEL